MTETIRSTVGADKTSIMVLECHDKRQLDLVLFNPEQHVTVYFPKDFPGDVHIEPGTNPPSLNLMKDFCRRFNNKFHKGKDGCNMHLLIPENLAWRVTIEVKNCVGIHINRHLLDIATKVQGGHSE
ncbi:MAG: hypothetical protein ACKKL5_01195 [Candidatus Komeilibacteria bacterium]